MNIPFNKPFLTGKETQYIQEAVLRGKISGNGHFTQLCHRFFESRYGIKKVLLTTSCTDALEMAAILIDIQAGDEVIIPSYTFPSSANAFIMRGAKIIFCDSKPNHPSMDETQLEQLITSKTKAIVPVHYAGVACDMGVIMKLAEKYQLFVIEDAAQAIEGTYTFSDGRVKALGSIGHLATFSFHETKNIISGEGGLLAINDDRFVERAEIIWEKGTNRSAFFRGEVEKYNWVDIGSSYLPSEIIAAFLYAQLEEIETIQTLRKKIWNTYYQELSNRSDTFELPFIPNYSSNNAHMFYLVFKQKSDRAKTIQALKKEGILAVFHYLSLHKSPYYKEKYTGASLVYSDFYSDNLLRLPFFNNLTSEERSKVIEIVVEANK